MNTLKLVDEYTLKARCIPALIVILPYLQITLSGQERFSDSLSGILLNSIFLFIVSHIVRGWGADKQYKLFKSWGGSPSTLIMRWNDTTLTNLLKERYHNCLSSKLSISLPTLQEENNDPRNADDIYAVAIKWLQEQTRDNTKFYLLFQENISYGFWRNLFAVKWAGIIIAIFSLILSIVDIIRLIYSQTQYDKNIILSPLICLAVLCFWFISVREKKVKIAAYTYAKTLLAQCDNLN